MCYNEFIHHVLIIFFLEVFNMTITKDSIIGDVLDMYPETAEHFFSIGMHCLGCPAARGETIAEACQVHGTNADELVAKLNEAIA